MAHHVPLSWTAYGLIMPTENATVVVYDSPEKAESALRELKSAGFDLKSVSVAGRDGEGQDSAACLYEPGAGMRCWGKAGTFWNAVWGMLPECAFLTVTGVGRVLVAGPLSGWVITGLENAAIFSGLSALGAALYSMGMSRDAVRESEAALAAGKYLVMAHGPSGEVARAKGVLRANGFGARRMLSR
jgi:hypothetical protein